MADDIQEQEDGDVELEGKKPKKSMGATAKLIIWIVVGLMVISGAIVGTLFVLGFFDSSEEISTGDVVAEKPAIVKPEPAMYFPIKPAFVIDYQWQGRKRFLQAELSVLTRDENVFNALQTHLPLIKHRLGLLFSGEIYDELQTREGKELLRQKSLEELQQILQEEIGETGVEEVLVTSFVMQ